MNNSDFHAKPLNSNPNVKICGIYTKEQRLLKIKYYKEKMNKWRLMHPINRGFHGRKMVAKIKPRIRGKFVKNAHCKNL